MFYDAVWVFLFLSIKNNGNAEFGNPRDTRLLCVKYRGRSLSLLSCYTAHHFLSLSSNSLAAQPLDALIHLHKALKISELNSTTSIFHRRDNYSFFVTSL